MPFLTPLRITSIRRTNKYRLDKALIYRSVELDRVFAIPAGTETDFASIPGFVKFWMDDDGGFIRDAAVVHDYLYSVESTETHPDITRKIADGIIVEGMKDLKASWIKRQAVYWALRGAGWAAYKTGLLP